jgi:hypothetical protein
MTAPVPVPALPSTVRLAWHLCRHDLARFRVLAAVMVGLELLRAAYAEWALQLAPFRADARSGIGEGEMELDLLDLVMWGLIWLVTAIVVQADHPSDDRAFWRTRPIAPASVALAKLLVLTLVFVGVPSAINAVRLAAYGAPLFAHVAAPIQIAAAAGSAIVPAWAFAIATRTLPRFIAAAGALVAFIYAAVITTSPVQGGFGAAIFSLAVGLSDWSRSTALGWLPALGLAMLGLGILVAHYALRRPWTAAAAGAALACLPPFLPVPNPAAEPPPEIAALIAAPLTPPAGLWVDPGGFTSSTRASVILSGRLAVPALPRDLSAGVFVDRARVLVDGADVATGGFHQCCLGRGPLAVALSRPVTRNDGEGGSEMLATVRTEALPDLFTKPVTLDAEATIVFERHRLVASLPLQDGAAFAGEGYLVELVAARAATADAVVRISRFPALSRVSLPRLSFFHANAARTMAAESPAPFVSSLRPAATPVRERVQGRRWAGRYQLMLPGGVVGPDRRLLIVESRRAGESRARIVASGAPVSRRRPEPR